jgi:hypothetical protein
VSHSAPTQNQATPSDWRSGSNGEWRLNISSFGKNWNRSRPRGRVFISPFPTDHNPVVIGISRDSTGAALGNCVVKLYRTWDDVMINQTVSDGSGNFSLYALTSGPYYVVAYLPGSPDVAGTTLNTLVAA